MVPHSALRLEVSSKVALACAHTDKRSAARDIMGVNRVIQFLLMRTKLAWRPGLLPPQSTTIPTRMLRKLITRGCFSEGEGLENFCT